MANLTLQLIPIVLAVAAIVIVIIQSSATKKHLNKLNTNLDALERKQAELGSRIQDTAKKNDETNNLKVVKLKEEVMTSISSFAESVRNRVTELEATQKQQYETLMHQFTTLQGKERQQEAKQPMASVDNSRQKDSPIHEKARRLARLIVSEIALYSSAAVEQGIRNQNFRESLAHEIKEAQTLYNQRVPEEIRNNTNYLEDAFADLISRKKAELNIS